MGAAVGSGATELVATVTLPDDRGTTPTTLAPATTEDPATIARIMALIDSLPEVPPGRYSCPAAFGGSLDLVFRSASGATLAEAVDGFTGCGFTSVSIGGVQKRSVEGGTQLIVLVEQLLPTGWPPPSALRSVPSGLQVPA